MKKNSVLYHIFGLFLLPTLLVCILTAIGSFATANYEYLPEGLDGLGNVFFYVSTYALDLLIFFIIGAFCFAVYERNVISAVICAVVALFHSGLLPMLMFFMRSLFLSAYSSADVMEQYWEYDVYSAMSNFTRVCVGIVIALAVMLIYIIRKNKNEFKKPYIVPKSEPAMASLVMCAGYIIYSSLIFTLDGVYTEETFASLGLQVAFAAIGYFVVILGAYAQKSFCAKSNMDNLNKN
ncbi:MAG: hypothetical protein IJX55_05800 [Clostridia bacterium]|nr:hypothetical protein [Clostridia bacterium]